MADDGQATSVTLFGGTGFLGREIAQHLAADGMTLRVAVRHPDRAAAVPGKLQALRADVRDEETVARAVAGADAVVNAVGLYVESGGESFAAVHEEGAQRVARLSASAGVTRLVQISGIGADPRSASRYVRARAEGERLVREAFPQATILRPSAIFGPSDSFLNSLAAIARAAPVIPLFGRGDTKLQPVYVGDVAAAVSSALRLPEAPGRTYELGGPQVVSYRALIELVLRRTKRRRPLLPVPFLAWDALALMASPLPRPPLTPAQVTLMKQDNVVGAEALSLADLGITATALEEVLPDYGF